MTYVYITSSTHHPSLMVKILSLQESRKEDVASPVTQ